MKQQFHMTPDGPKQCTASVKTCQYGDSQHFDNMKDAQKVFENEMTAKHGVSNSLSKNKNAWTSSTTEKDVAQKIVDDLGPEEWNVDEIDQGEVVVDGLQIGTGNDPSFQITKNNDNTFTVEELNFPVKTDFNKKTVGSHDELVQFAKHHQGLSDELHMAQDEGFDEQYEAIIVEEGQGTYYPSSRECQERYAGEGDTPEDFARNLVEDTVGDSCPHDSASHYAQWIDREKLAEDLEDDDYIDDDEETPDYSDMADTFVDVWVSEGNGERIKKYMDYDHFADDMQKDGSMTFVDSQRENKVFGFFPG